MRYKTRRSAKGLSIVGSTGGSDDKIGFFDATPVAKQAAIADATNAGTTQSGLNSVLAVLRAYGLILPTLFVLGLLLLAILTAPPVQAYSDVTAITVTNAVPASTTESTTVGQVIDISNHADFGLLLSFQGAGPDTGNVTLTFVRAASAVIAYAETTPKFTVTVAASGTNVVQWPYVYLKSIQNAATNAVTNITLYVVMKHIY